MTSRPLELRAGEAEVGERLDKVLGSSVEVGSRAAAQRLLAAGRVTVDGRRRDKGHRLALGELVRVEAAEAEPDEGPPAPHAIVYEDDNLIVVDKPAGVVVHPAAGHRHGTLVQALADRAAGGADPERPGVVHRLDRDTSGLLIVAKDDAAHAALQRALRERRIEREYLALVEGTPDAEHGTIDAPIGRDRGRRTIVSTRTDKPREAVTHFRLAEALPRTSLLEVRLETGRTHQVRAHLAAIGHSVVGDAAYGGGDSGRRLGLERQFLHSAQLRFSHPVTGELLSCESKPPAELSRAIDAARREPTPGGPDGS